MPPPISANILLIHMHPCGASTRTAPCCKTPKHLNNFQTTHLSRVERKSYEWVDIIFCPLHYSFVRKEGDMDLPPHSWELQGSTGKKGRGEDVREDCCRDGKNFREK
jgi:hypothetical protein